MNKSLFFYFSAFFTGLLVGHFFPNYFSFLSYYLVIAFLLLAFIFRKFRYLFYVFLVISFFIFGLVRLQGETRKESQLSTYWGENSNWSFWVCSDPEPAWDGQRVVLCFIGQPGENEKVITKLPLYPRVSYGDYLELKCRLEKPMVFPDFDYASYLKVKGISSTCSWPQITTLKKKLAGPPLSYQLFKIKRQALSYLNRYLPEPAAGLASSLILGYKKTLYDNEAEALRRAGLSHLIAISGAHISLLLYLLINFFIYLGLYKRQALLPSYILLITYVIMTGMQASAIRALFMGGMLLYAWQAGRLERSINLLILAAMIMLIINPLLWRYDLGFQLSFTALTGMIVCQPIFCYYSQKYFSRLYSSFLKPVFDTFYLSLSAQLLIWPIIAVQMKTVSLISPITNIFAFLVFTPLMLSLIVALIFSFLGLGSLLTFWPAYVFLQYILILARKFSSWPLSSIDLNNFTSTQATLYYLTIFILICLIKKKISLSKKNGVES